VQQSIDISCPPGPQQQTCSSGRMMGQSRGVVGRGRGRTASPHFFDRGTRLPLPPLFGLKFVQKLVHGCSWLLTETHNFSTAELIFYVTVNLFLSLVSGVLPLFRTTPKGQRDGQTADRYTYPASHTTWAVPVKNSERFKQWRRQGGGGKLPPMGGRPKIM